MLPISVMLNTWIGMLLSMHKEIAVESMTLSPRFKTSRKVSVSKRWASGWVLGSQS